MRIIPVLLVLVTLSGCETLQSFLPDDTTKPVDATTLAPLSAREQALIFGADGAAAQGNTAAAERDYLAAVALSTGHVDAHLALAQLYAKQHSDAKELEILDRALALQPNHTYANYLRGKLALDAGKYDDAIGYFDHGLITDPDNIDLAIGKGVANDMQGNHTAAQMVYARAMKVNPNANLTNIRTNLAMSFLLSDQPKDAVELLKNEARKPGASSVTRHNLALAYGLLGRHGDARKILNGEIDEETRTLALARLKEYIRDHKSGTALLKPAISDAAKPATSSTRKAIVTMPDDADDATVKPAAKKSPSAFEKSMKEKPAAPVKPVAKKPVAEPEPESIAAPEIKKASEAAKPEPAKTPAPAKEAAPEKMPAPAEAKPAAVKPAPAKQAAAPAKKPEAKPAEEDLEYDHNLD